MFIAHLPAGYLVSALLAGRKENATGLIATGLAASALPDTDLLWFYLVDNRQTAHHEYVFHWPMFWLGLSLLAWAYATLAKKKSLIPYIAVALACLMTHMLLDSFAAEIYWLRPFADLHLNAVVVPTRFDWWVWNFVFHWIFAAEITICTAAGLLFCRRQAV